MALLLMVAEPILAMSGIGLKFNRTGTGASTVTISVVDEKGADIEGTTATMTSTHEFKGTGNMEMILDRKLSEKRIFPAIDIQKSGTRREDLLLTPDELEAVNIMRRALNGLKPDEATDKILDMFSRTRNNSEFVYNVKKNKFI